VIGAIVKIASGEASRGEETSGPLQAIPAELNDAATARAEWVHLGEIVVIPAG
jgi:hypothetical protein